MIDLNNPKKIFFSIKEVAEHFNVNESHLRFLEKKFDEVKPRKTAGGTRQYTREDIKAISMVLSLVKERGLTLDGAKQVLKTKKGEEERRVELLERLEKIKNELQSLLKNFE